LSYFAGRAVLVIEYLRAAKHIPQARKLATRYATGFAIAACLWLLSAFVPIPQRFVLVGIGLLIDFATPLTAKRLQQGLLPHPEHLPERFGLFTIIVLGEAIIAVVDGVSEQKWDIQSAIAPYSASASLSACGGSILRTLMAPLCGLRAQLVDFNL
jgi:low temperature requirement protein LtrA